MKESTFILLLAVLVFLLICAALIHDAVQWKNPDYVKYRMELVGKH